MYCPRCATPITEATKFCKSCGLPLTQVYSYVTSGGTAPLALAPQPSEPGGLTPKQRLVLTILLFAFAPAIIAVIGESGPLGNELKHLFDSLAGLSGVLMPIGIVWAVFNYKAKMRKLRQRREQPVINPSQQPAVPGTAYQPPLPPHRTNPLSAAPPQRGSVIEDETQRLPDR